MSDNRSKRLNAGRDDFDTKPKEIVVALAVKGITVLPNMTSIVKAKSNVKSARRQADRSSENGSATASSASGLDAALVLYQAAQGRDIPQARIRQAFITLVNCTVRSSIIIDLRYLKKSSRRRRPVIGRRRRSVRFFSDQKWRSSFVSSCRSFAVDCVLRCPP
jgi:hypothetical protein